MLRSRRRNVDIQCALTGALWNLASDESAHAAFLAGRDSSDFGNGSACDGSGASGSVLSALLESMDSHVLCSALQAQCCGVLWSLAACPGTRDALSPLALHACVARVVRTLRLLGHQQEVAHPACAALCNLVAWEGDTVGSDSGQAVDAVEVAVGHGAVGAVVAVLETHAAGAVCTAGCMALWALLTPRHRSDGAVGKVHGGGLAAAKAAGALPVVAAVAVRTGHDEDKQTAHAASAVLSLLLCA